MGDSITRGSYLAAYETGPLAGEGIGLPDPAAGGWRRPLQDKLRAAGITYDFVGELDYGAYGRDGVVDRYFAPRHHGLAGFSNQLLLTGGVVPTPRDVLEDLGVSEIHAPGVVTALARHRPDVILLMSGTNGFGAEARDLLISTILSHFSGWLLVATIPPQCPPRLRYQCVDAYNDSLAGAVAERAMSGSQIAYVDMNSALTVNDLLPDGVHPDTAGMDKMADVWWAALQPLIA
jgi:lysophospholipase L1-like esterase